MAEIQLPGLETIEKLWNWASNQGSIFPEVWADPRSYFEKFEQNENPLPTAISFFCFVLLLQIVIELPIAIAVLKYNPLQVSTIIELITTAVLQAGVFSFAMFILARMLGSKASLRDTLASMLFATVYTPLLSVRSYVEFFDPDFVRNFATEDKLIQSMPLNGFLIASGLITFAIYVYITWKVIPLIKAVHRFGLIRAITSFGGAAIVWFVFILVVMRPITKQLIRTGGLALS
jgi:predicted Na+-dependent transporter